MNHLSKCSIIGSIIVLMGILGIVYKLYIHLFSDYSSNSTKIIWTLGGFFLILDGYIFKQQMISFKTWGFVNGCLLLVGITFLVGVLLAQQGTDREANAVIVLASSFDKEGELSVYTKARLEKAIEISNSGSCFILSGGGRNIRGETEAALMKEYLLARNIEDKSIFIEANSKDTYENLNNINLLYRNKIDQGKTVIVTNDYHLFRVKMIAGVLGFGDIGYISAKTDLLHFPDFVVREICAFIRELLMGRLL